MDSASEGCTPLKQPADFGECLWADVSVRKGTATDGGVITCFSDLQWLFQIRLNEGLINSLLFSHLQHLGRKIEPITRVKAMLCQILCDESRPAANIQDQA